MEHAPAQELAGALEALQRALLGHDAAAIVEAADRTRLALYALELNPPSRAALEHLAALNDAAGALVAARQAATNWALSRLQPERTTLYGSDGQHTSAPAQRRIASA